MKTKSAEQKDNTTPPDFLEKKFTLIKPVNKMDVVTVKPITLAQSVELEYPSGDESEIEIEDQVKLVMYSTGLTEGEVYSLTKPDFNSIFEAAHHFLTLDAYHLAGKDLDESKLDLYLLFTGGRHITFDFPTLRLSKQSKDADFDSDSERAVFIISNITDLDADEIENMLMPDYRSLVSRTSDFLTSPAAFYQ